MVIGIGHLTLGGNLPSKQLSVEINQKNTRKCMAVRLFIHINSVCMENDATRCLS